MKEKRTETWEEEKTGRIGQDREEHMHWAKGVGHAANLDIIHENAPKKVREKEELKVKEEESQQRKDGRGKEEKREAKEQ